MAKGRSVLRGASPGRVENAENPVDETLAAGSLGLMSSVSDSSARELLEHAGFIRGLAQGLLPDDAEVEDIVQDLPERYREVAFLRFS